MNQSFKFERSDFTNKNVLYNILKRLDFNDKEIFKLCHLIEYYDTLIRNEEIISNKELAITKFKIQCCDALAHNPTKLEIRIKYLLDINEKINTGKEKENYINLISKFSK